MPLNIILTVQESIDTNSLDSEKKIEITDIIGSIKNDVIIKIQVNYIISTAEY